MTADRHPAFARTCGKPTLRDLIADLAVVHRFPFSIESDRHIQRTGDPEMAWHCYEHECALTDGPVAIARRGWVIHERGRIRGE